MHDSQEFKTLVDATDNAVLADSAYISEESEAHLRDCNCEEFLMRKGKRGTPLSEEEKATNKKMPLPQNLWVNPGANRIEAAGAS